MISKIHGKEYLHEPIIDKCLEGKPCEHAVAEGDGQICVAYLYPSKKWRLGNCALATNVIEIVPLASAKKRVGQQKQKKH